MSGVTMDSLNERSSWMICDRCGRFGYCPRVERHHKVCPACGCHYQLTALERMATIFDPGTLTTWEPRCPDNDPLAFTDSMTYGERIENARVATGLSEAIVLARGCVMGVPVTGAVLDFRFMGGSLGSAVGNGVLEACCVALRDRTPLIIVSASGGARMQEGVVALLQMARTAQALAQLDEAGLMSISLVTDPTYGGVAASFATLCDVIVAEPRARLGFAGRRVIEQTMRETLPEDFQTAEFLLARGFIDLVVPRGGLRSTIGRLAGLSRDRDTPIGPRSVPPTASLVTDPEELPERHPWDVVRKSRQLDRPTTVEYVSHIIDDFVELHGDRLARDCTAIVAGFGTLGGRCIALIGTQKGHTATELASRNYGMPTPSGYRKAARVMRLADKLGVPVVTLIDTAGAYPGIEAEERGQAFAIAEGIQLMSRLKVPTIAVVTGEGGSGGALALAVADRVFVLSNATYSVITPEGCASILWHDPTEAPRAAAALRVDPASLLRLGVVDGVIDEPIGGAGEDHVLTAERLSATVDAALRELEAMEPADLVARRRCRYMAAGTDEQVWARPVGGVPATARDVG